MKLTDDHERFIKKWIAEVEDDELAKLGVREFECFFETRILPYHPKSNEFRKMIDKLTLVNKSIEALSSLAPYYTTVMPNFR